MSSGANGEWVRQGTPRDDNADWNEEQSEYGTAVSPTEWDDYSSEQSVPVEAPRPQVPDGVATAGSAPSPTEREYQAVPGQEPGADEEYRSDESGGSADDSPAGDPDDGGLDPTPSDWERDGSTAVTGMHDAPVALDSSVGQAETTRPRPIVPDAAVTAVGAGEPSHVEDSPGPDDAPHHEHDDSAAPAGENNTSDAPADVADARNDDVEENSVQHHEDDEMEATQVVPVTALVVDDTESSTETTGNIPDGLYRAGGAETTAVIAPEAYPDVDVEEERLQARLDAERQAREQRLGAVPTSSENAIREDEGPARVTTDKFLPSFALFVLRIVTAAILGATSWLILGQGVDATANFLGNYPLIPEPRLVAWILGFTLGAMALLLVIGLLQRVVGFLLLAIAVAVLALIRWGSFPIFVADVEGFIGDKDLLLAAVGLLLLAIGGGKWGIDGAFRASRAASKAEREG